MRAASASSSGIVRKNWRNRKVAVADAISGTVRPGIRVEHAEVGDHLERRQDAHLDRQHQRDEDHPEEEHRGTGTGSRRSRTPTAARSRSCRSRSPAPTRGCSASCARPARTSRRSEPLDQHLRVVLDHLVARDQRSSATRSTCSAVSVDATNVTYSGNATHGHAQDQHEVRDDGQPRAVLDQVSTEPCFSMNRNWTTVSAIRIVISTTDCAAEPPRSSPRKPSL